MRYTEEMCQFLIEYAPKHRISEIQAAFEGRFGIKPTKAAVSVKISRLGVHSCFDGKFQKGRTSPNKGKKLEEMMPPESAARFRQNQFQKGHKLKQVYKVGDEKVVSHDFLAVLTPEGWKRKHYLVWEQHHGKVPEGHYVVFADGNKRNFDIENLVCVSCSQHIKLGRMGVYGSGKEIIEASKALVDLQSKLYKLERGKE